MPGATPRTTTAPATAAIRTHLVGSLVLSVFVNLLFLASPLYMMQLYGRVLDSGSIETLVALSAALMLALVAMAAADAGRGRLLARAAARIERRLCGPIAAAGKDTAARLADLGHVRQVISGSSATTLFDAPFTLMFLATLFLLHPMLGLVATLGAAVILVAVGISRLISAPRDLDLARDQAGIDRLAEAADRGRDDLRALGADTGVVARLATRVEAAVTLRQRGAEHSAAIGAFTRMVRMAAHSAALATGAVLTLQGELSASAMLAAAILAGRALGPMETLSSALRQARSARAALGRIDTTLDAAAGSRSAPPAELRGALPVQMSRAMVLHPGANRAALRAASLYIAPGEVICVDGETGSGKSTLLRVMAGIETLKSGEARLAGQDPARLTAQARQSMIGWLPQDVVLYPGTVAENIARFADTPPEAVTQAVARAGAGRLIDRLPSGLHTQVGEGGVPVSPGTRQAIGLARALIGTPSLVLLDQPTAHADAEGEVAVLNAVKSLREAGVTVVIASHKPVLASLCDRILIMGEGRVDLFEDRDTVIDAMRRQTLGSVPRRNAPGAAPTTGQIPNSAPRKEAS